MDPLHCISCDHKYVNERKFQEHLTRDKHVKNVYLSKNKELEEQKHQIVELRKENQELRERIVLMENVARNLACKAVSGTSQDNCKECELASDDAVLTEVDIHQAMAEINHLKQEVTNLRAGDHVVQLEAELAASKMREEVMSRDVTLLKERVQNLIDEFEKEGHPGPNQDWKLVEMAVRAKEISASLELVQIKRHMHHLVAEKQNLEKKIEEFIELELEGKMKKRHKRKSKFENDQKKAKMDANAMNEDLHGTHLQTSSTPLSYFNSPCLPQPSCSTIPSVL